MAARMTIKGLVELVEQGPVAIEFLPGCDEMERYPEAGMRAMLVRVDGYNQSEDAATVTFNYEPFDAYNRAFESSNYYDDDGKACLTAREAERYMPLEKHFVTASFVHEIFRLIEGPAVQAPAKTEAQKHAALVGAYLHRFTLHELELILESTKASVHAGQNLGSNAQLNAKQALDEVIEQAVERAYDLDHEPIGRIFEENR